MLIEVNGIVLRGPLSDISRLGGAFGQIIALDPSLSGVILADPAGQIVTCTDGRGVILNLLTCTAGEGLLNIAVRECGAGECGAVGLDGNGGHHGIGLVQSDGSRCFLKIRDNDVVVGLEYVGSVLGPAVEHGAHDVIGGSRPRIVHIDLARAGCGILDDELKLKHPGLAVHRRSGVGDRNIGVNGDHHCIVVRTVETRGPLGGERRIVGDAVMSSADALDIVVIGVENESIGAALIRLEESVIIHEYENRGAGVEVGL